jgi:hypothetical protein
MGKLVCIIPFLLSISNFSMFNIKINIQSQPPSIKHVLGSLKSYSVNFENIHLSTWAPHCYALTINKSIDEKIKLIL